MKLLRGRAHTRSRSAASGTPRGSARLTQTLVLLASTAAPSAIGVFWHLPEERDQAISPVFREGIAFGPDVGSLESVCRRLIVGPWVTVAARDRVSGAGAKVARAHCAQSKDGKGTVK